MLILISGASGTGKTTLAECLELDFGWKFVPTLMTRPPRMRERDKKAISREQFSKMNDNGEFFCVDEFFGHSYASPKTAIQRALENQDEVWLKDRPLARLGLFKDIAHGHIIVLPENEEQLISRITQSGRLERLSVVLDDYRDNYSRFHHEKIESLSTIVVTNYNDEIYATASKINLWLQHLQHQPIESCKGSVLPRNNKGV